MKHLRKYNENFTSSSDNTNIDSDILEYLDRIVDETDHKDLADTVAKFKEEVSNGDSDVDKLWAYIDDISIFSEETDVDSDEFLSVYKRVEHYLSDLRERQDAEEFHHSLPPEEGGPTFSDNDLKKILKYFYTQGGYDRGNEFFDEQFAKFMKLYKTRKLSGSEFLTTFESKINEAKDNTWDLAYQDWLENGTYMTTDGLFEYLKKRYTISKKSKKSKK